MQRLSRLLLCLFCSGITVIQAMTSSEQNLPALGADLEKIYLDQKAECLNKQFKSYAPPIEMQQILDGLFEPDFFEQLEAQEDPISWLKSEGFKILQFYREWPHATVIVESDQLPGYVIKFMRVTAPAARFKRVRVKSTPTMSTRVVHARELKKMITSLNLKYIKIPDKYFYCVHNIALAIAKKVIPSNRMLHDLNGEEIEEILKIVARAKGMLDLKPRNFLFTDDAIFFIDTERGQNPKWWEITKHTGDWQNVKGQRSLGHGGDLGAFKAAINPAYLPIVDSWQARQDKRLRLQHRRSVTPLEDNVSKDW